MSKKPDILFIASWYPNKYEPTNGDFIQRHAKAVSRFCNVSVIHVFAADQKENFISEIIQNEAITEIRVYHKKLQKKIHLLSQLINYRRKMQAFKIAWQLLLKHKERPDAVHLNVFFYGGIFALYLKRKFKIPYIVTEHWTKFLDSSPRKFKLLETLIIRRTAQKASIICPVSHDLKNALKNFGVKGPYKVIPNVTNTEHFKYRRREKIAEKIEVLHASHMRDNHKNITGILNALRMVSQHRQDIVLRFLGSQDTRQYKDYAEKIGLPKNMYEFLGKVPYEKVAENMSTHDIFLMFSNYENLPCVISEAHVSGLPVISSDVGGISEMIDPTNGRLVKAKDETALAEAIRETADKLSAFKRSEISKQAEKRYSYESVGRQYTDLYKIIISGK